MTAMNEARSVELRLAVQAAVNPTVTRATLGKGTGVDASQVQIADRSLFHPVDPGLLTWPPGVPLPASSG
jgi:hypothetical protein